MTDPTAKEERERLRAGAEMAAALGFDVTVSGNTLLSLVDAAAERDALRERVAELTREQERAQLKGYGDGYAAAHRDMCNDPTCGMCGRGSGR